MLLLHKIKEVIISVLPISLLVLLLHFTIAPLPAGMIAEFIVGSLLLVVGLALFLLGTDLGVLPMGQLMGDTLIKNKRLWITLILSFCIGFMVTLAEPDLHVLGEQLAGINPFIPKALLLIMVSVGVGLFVSVGMLRTIFNLSLKKVLFIGYNAVFALALFASPYLLPVSFDSGGVTTGPMTVPFIMAMCIGMAQIRPGVSKSSEEDSFGLVGLMSLGPIISCLILGVVFKQDMSSAFYEVGGSTSLGALLPKLMKEVMVALLPMIVIFLLFQFVFLKLPARHVLRMGVGMLYTYAGLVIFLLGVNYGFLPAGGYLGKTLASLPYNWILIPVGVLLGLTIVLAEPAVWVLTQQIEKITAGLISKKVMLATLSIGVAVAVGLAMLRVYTGLHIMWLLIPGYLAALLLMRYVDTVFTAIAFDSGGVASGVMASTFILPFALGACASIGHNVLTDAFGAVAMIAMIPLIAIQLLGLVFRLKRERVSEEHDELTRIEAEIEAEEEALMRQAQSLRAQALDLEQEADALRQRRMGLSGEAQDESPIPGAADGGQAPEARAE
jgi:hypothetical protein